MQWQKAKALVTMANDICLRFQMTLIILQGVIGDTMVAMIKQLISLIKLTYTYFCLTVVFFFP